MRNDLNRIYRIIEVFREGLITVEEYKKLVAEELQED